MTMTRRVVAVMALLIVLPVGHVLLSYGDDVRSMASTGNAHSDKPPTTTRHDGTRIDDLLVQPRVDKLGDRVDALATLRQVKIASRALSHVRASYVDPQRIQPRQMMEAAMQAVAHYVPEMLTEVPKRDDNGIAEPVSPIHHSCQ